jgi:hypothetical protein
MCCVSPVQARQTQLRQEQSQQGEQPAANQKPIEDSATFDADGTALITRVVPMPSTVSPEARKYLSGLEKGNHPTDTLEQRRTGTDAWRKKQSAEARRIFP